MHYRLWDCSFGNGFSCTEQTTIRRVLLFVPFWSAWKANRCWEWCCDLAAVWESAMWFQLWIYSLWYCWCFVVCRYPCFFSSDVILSILWTINLILEKFKESIRTTAVCESVFIYSWSVRYILSPEETSAFIWGFSSINANVSDPRSGQKHSRAQLRLKQFLLSSKNKTSCHVCGALAHFCF